MKTNFHTHHVLCGHAGGTCQDYIEEAIKQGFLELGFSDHAPDDEFDMGFRMKDDDFQGYLDDMNVTKKQYSKQLTTYRGIEIEHWYNRDHYYHKFMEHLDYMILGQHFISLNKDNQNLISSFGLTKKEEILAYGETLCDAMHTKRYQIIAHPELYMHGYKDFDETATQVAHMICKCAEQTDTILEYNANGFRRPRIVIENEQVPPYPRKEFWKIVELYDIRTMINSDCHGPSQLYDDIIQEAEEEYEKLDVKKIQFFKEITR